MTITRVGTGTGKVLLDSAANPCLITGLTATSAGDLVIVPFSFNGASVNITAAQGQNGSGTNLGGTWSVLQSSLSAGNNRAGIVYCLSAPAGVTQIQLTGSAGSPFGVASADRFTYAGTLSLDTGSTPAGGFRSAVETGTSTTVPLNSGNLTLSSANNAILVFAYGSDDSANGTVTIGGSGTYTSTHNEGDTTTHHAGAGGFQIVAATGPHNVTGLYNQENASGAIIIAAFIESGGGGGGGTDPQPNYDNGIPTAWYVDPGFIALYGPEQQGIPLANRDNAGTTVSAAGSASIVFSETGAGASVVAAAGSGAIVFNEQGAGASTAASAFSSQIAINATGTGAASSAGSGDGSIGITFGATAAGASTVAGDGSVPIIINGQGAGASTAAGAGNAPIVFDAQGDSGGAPAPAPTPTPAPPASTNGGAGVMGRNFRRQADDEGYASEHLPPPHVLHALLSIATRPWLH